MKEAELEKESDPFLHDDDSQTTLGAFQYEKKNGITWRWLLLSIIATTAIVCPITLYIARSCWQSHLDQTCARHTSQYDTILRDVKIVYTTTHINGSIPNSSIYRDPPSPEVDAAWADLGTLLPAMLVPAEQAEAAGLDSHEFFMATEEQGGPGYPVMVETLHQLHCLNLVRRALYFNVDYYREHPQGPFLDSERMLQWHIGHCVDLLRQVLMCSADTGVIPFVWAGSPPHLYPYFDREHKCRNFEDIKDYVSEHLVPWGHESIDVKPQEGDFIFPSIP